MWYINKSKKKQNNFLKHSGIIGMHWGERRYQNEDGTLTPEGRERYGVGEPRQKRAYRDYNGLYPISEGPSKDAKTIPLTYDEKKSFGLNITEEDMNIEMDRLSDYRDEMSAGYEWCSSMGLTKNADDFLNRLTTAGKKMSNIDSEWWTHPWDYGTEGSYENARKKYF